MGSIVLDDTLFMPSADMLLFLHLTICALQRGPVVCCGVMTVFVFSWMYVRLAHTLSFYRA